MRHTIGTGSLYVALMCGACKEISDIPRAAERLLEVEIRRSLNRLELDAESNESSSA